MGIHIALRSKSGCAEVVDSTVGPAGREKEKIKEGWA